MPNSRFARTYMDYSEEKSTVRTRIRDVTAATITAVLTELVDLGNAIDAMSLGTLQKSILTQDDAQFVNAPPSDANAQRERKWLVISRDNTTGDPVKLEIPVARLVGASTDSLLLAHTDKADFAATEWGDFISAYELTARSDDGNTVTVEKAFLVGRNL